ncbi:class I SAM-dependent methyltransferase [Bacillus taeanensis]|uniref:SAM-dependent methyltransferase n=1 Tax=Bacillus taeanensis TaxID=273032 RepID=A0A366XWP5_9BACI|nr:SAM-dependent methyltransferase [Bacillus taeanensis]RBW70572.1 SAM-dependent methyltransferase [Bacillus taeanensis]
MIKEFLINKIKSSPNQCMDYAAFMETVLYDSQDGYYSKAQKKIGKQGDFYTSISVNPIFSRVVSRALIKMIIDENLPRVLCEIGAGEGKFAEVFLNEWERVCQDDFCYYAVEKSAYHQSLQYKHLGERVKYYNNVSELIKHHPSFEGIIFSNELFDAFPVHVVQQSKNQLYEVFVTVNDEGKLIERNQPCENQLILQWIEKYGFPLADKQRLEIPLQMTAYIKMLASWMKRGIIVTIDYGYTNEEWQHPARRNGSLRGYYRHQMIENPLLYLGEMDLTTHIYLDGLQKIGEDYGLIHIKTMSQTSFLLASGILEELEEHQDRNPFSETNRKNRAIRTLITQGDLSSYFHVIVQGKQIQHHNWK